MKTKILLLFLLLSCLTFLPAQETVTKVYNFNNWKNWGSTASYGLTALRPNGFFVEGGSTYKTGRLSKQVGFSGLTGDSCMVYSIANSYTPTWYTWHVAANVSVSNAATPVDEKAAFADFKIPYGVTYTVSFKAKSTAIPTVMSFGFVETATNGYDGRTADDWTLLKNISTQPLTSSWQTYSFTGTNLTMKTNVTPNLQVDIQNFTFQLSAQNKNVYIDDLTFSYTLLSQTITFGALSTKTYGDADFSPGATSATSGINPITYESSNSDVATIVNGQIHITGVGTTTITASQAGNGTYAAAANVQQTLTVNPIATSFSAPGSLGNAAELAGTDITVSNNAELTAGDVTTVRSITVTPGSKLTINAAINVTNGITLQSDAASTATLIDSYTEPTINATVKQHVTAGRNWYLSSPVSAAPFGWLNRGTSVQGWDEATKAWVPVTSGNLVRGKGYVQVATTTPTTTGTTGTVDVNGTTNSGDVAITVSRTESGTSRGFNLVGNPYPSYLKWGTGENGFLADATNDSISTSFWYRTKNSSDAYVFTTYNGTSHTVVGGTTLNNNALNEYIPPMQAFWIRVNPNATVTTHNVVLKFKNNMRFHGIGDNNKFKAPKNEQRKLIRLQLENGNQSDETLIYFDAAAANTFDNYDSPKMMNNSATQPDLYTTIGTERLAINGLNELNNDMEMPLGFTLKAATNGLKLKVSELNNFESGTKVYLLDKEQNSQTELLSATEYTFNTTASTINNENRFSLIFKSKGATTGIENRENQDVRVFVNAANQITIIAPEKAMFSIYNAVGQLIENGRITSINQTSNFKHAAGVYVVKVNNQSTRVVVK